MGRAFASSLLRIGPIDSTNRSVGVCIVGTGGEGTQWPPFLRAKTIQEWAYIDVGQ
ncbi:hypothetical protein CM1200mP19_0020 [bacterium]|nr:MAG: hypothetical protein CM1200mP19_0020 [bacterium]